MKTLSIIAAVAANNCIGKDNGLLCHLPGDLKRFKTLTLHHTVIMGRKTFESLPGGALPQRRNIVISNSLKNAEGCTVVSSFEDALALCKDENEVFIIGGGTLYRQTLSLANKLYITHINASFDGDTFFPPVNYGDWEQVYRDERAESEACPYSYMFADYIRKVN
jgi:dihydrofolate reductase